MMSFVDDMYYRDGFDWDCCDEYLGKTEGCKIGVHESVNAGTTAHSTSRSTKGTSPAQPILEGLSKRRRTSSADSEDECYDHPGISPCTPTLNNTLIKNDIMGFKLISQDCRDRLREENPELYELMNGTELQEERPVKRARW